jgi:hypothetical protein
MKTLDGYKNATAELKAVEEIIKVIDNELLSIGKIEISASVTVSTNGSEAQFIYGIGILNSQILACKELGLSAESKEEIKIKVILLWTLYKELKEWTKFGYELEHFTNEAYNLLTDKEKFSLLKYPVKG